MNKHHAAKVRETLLKLFLVRLEDATANRDGVNVTMPVNSETATIVINGIRRALEGKDDPFKIRPPQGIKPKLNRAQWHLLAATVAFLATDNAIDEAFRKAAEAFRIVGTGTAKQAFYDVGANDPEWGRLLIHQWRQQIDQILDGVPVSRVFA